MKNLTLEKFKKIHEDWKSTGLSIRDYCSNTDIDESKFYYWRKKLINSLLPQPKGFVPIQMSRQDSKVAIGSSQAQNTENNVACEIVYQNGVILRVNNDMPLETLRSLILLCQ